MPIQDGTGIVFWEDHWDLGLRQFEPSKLLEVRPWHHIEDLDGRLAATLDQPPFAQVLGASVASDRLAVFDSANPGFDMRAPMLRASLAPEQYAVSTCDEAFARKVGATLHLIERTG